MWEKKDCRATPTHEKNKRYKLTINRKLSLINKQKMDLIGLKMKAHEENLKKQGLPCVPSDIAAKMPNKILEQNMRKSRRKC